MKETAALLTLTLILAVSSVSAQDAWKPGSPHPDSPHVVAGVKSGTWRPEPGYRYINEDQDDLRETEDDPWGIGLLDR